MNRPKAVIIGAGALGLGFLAERMASDYDLCLADLAGRSGILGQIERNQGFAVKICGLDESRVAQVTGSFEVAAMDDSDRLDHALREADLILTATGRKALDSIVPRIAPALSDGRKRWLLFCENGLNIAATYKPSFGGSVVLADTVMSRMCRMAEPGEAGFAPMWPGSGESLVVEEYGFIPLDAGVCAGGPFSPAFTLVSPEDFLCWEDMKLYLHNGVHAFVAYHGYLGGARLFKDVSPALRTRARRLALEEVAPAIARTHPTVSAGMIEEYGLGLLERFVSPAFNDTISRGIRGTAEKLAPGERLLGGCEYIRAARIEPVEYSSTIEAAKQVIQSRGELLSEQPTQ